MPGPRIELPTIQNWSCHNRGGCCRQHCIEITEQEQQRIVDQKWTEADGIPPNQSVIVKYGGLFRKSHYRLAHQPDGACVFLDDQGLCRIHAKLGEDAKPLACRIYPYAFHPAGKKVAVSLRFSCPSVVANLGQPVADQSKNLRQIARQLIPDGSDNIPPPRISEKEQLDWPDTLRFVAALDEIFAQSNASVTYRLLKALSLIELADQAQFTTVRGERLDDFLAIISEAAEAETPQDLSTLGEPSRLGLLQFRLLVAQYARKDTFAEQSSGWSNRLNLLRAATRFARRKGVAPPLQSAFREVAFEKLELSFGGIPEEAEEIFIRYFRVKIQGLHFFGSAYYDVPLVEGFRSLAMIFPSVFYLARWLAAGDGRDRLSTDDVARAIAIADHHHGYSPAFGQGNFRRRIRNLAKMNDITKLCAWYSR